MGSCSANSDGWHRRSCRNRPRLARTGSGPLCLAQSRRSRRGLHCEVVSMTIILVANTVARGLLGAWGRFVAGLNLCYRTAPAARPLAQRVIASPEMLRVTSSSTLAQRCWWAGDCASSAEKEKILTGLWQGMPYRRVRRRRAVSQR